MANELIRKEEAVLAGIIILLMYLLPACDSTTTRLSNRRYFEIQSKAIEASVADELQRKVFSGTTRHTVVGNFPRYLDDAFRSHARAKVLIQFPSGSATDHDYRPAAELVKSDTVEQLGIDLRQENSRFEAYDKTTGKNLRVYEQKDLKTIRALVSDCNNWMEQKGRLACEFDGGSDYGMKPYTTILFNVAYLKYQDQKLGYRNGKYELVESSKPAIVLDVDSLLSRNAIARVVCYQLLTQTSSMLAENFRSTGQKLPVDEWGWSPLGYDDLNKYYVEKHGQWDNFAQKACKTNITFGKSGFEAKDTETGQKISFLRDDDLLNEALKELNFYREKCDFVNYFQIENYPMFLLSILRLYDVNLELDKASNKYVLAPGPTDPQRFFEIVAEFTFVNDKSDIEYLKKNLKSW